MHTQKIHHSYFIHTLKPSHFQTRFCNNFPPRDLLYRDRRRWAHPHELPKLGGRRSNHQPMKNNNISTGENFPKILELPPSKLMVFSTFGGLIIFRISERMKEKLRFLRLSLKKWEANPKVPGMAWKVGNII